MIATTVVVVTVVIAVVVVIVTVWDRHRYPIDRRISRVATSLLLDRDLQLIIVGADLDAHPLASGEGDLGAWSLVSLVAPAGVITPTVTVPSSATA